MQDVCLIQIWDEVSAEFLQCVICFVIKASVYKFASMCILRVVYLHAFMSLQMMPWNLSGLLACRSVMQL